MIKYIIVTILLLVPNTCLSAQLNWRSNLTELRAIPIHLNQANMVL